MFLVSNKNMGLCLSMTLCYLNLQLLINPLSHLGQLCEFSLKWKNRPYWQSNQPIYFSLSFVVWTSNSNLVKHLSAYLFFCRKMKSCSNTKFLKCFWIKVYMPLAEIFKLTHFANISLHLAISWPDSYV